MLDMQSYVPNTSNNNNNNNSVQSNPTDKMSVIFKFKRRRCMVVISASELKQ